MERWKDTHEHTSVRECILRDDIALPVADISLSDIVAKHNLTHATAEKHLAKRQR